ncbi:hypothetical protein IWW40_004494 [Coemansia sp. RSA 1250]|nr:hypothetical protein IWW40_004494 [Coemansia sp. RSA 1250]
MYFRSFSVLAVAAVALALLAIQVKTTLDAIGFGKTYTNVNTTSCRQIGHGVLHGCEDIIVDPHTGLAYLACGSIAARQRWLNPDDPYDIAHEAETDHVYVMSENDTFSEIHLLETAADNRLIPFSQPLRLHGFDIYWDPADPRLMTFMLVNHQPGNPAISIFSFKRGADYMVHVETVASELLRSPNNILALSPRAFYATNDVKYTHGIKRSLSANLRLAHGSIVLRNETGHFSVAAPAIRYPNGIARYNNTVLVASCSDPGIRTFSINPDYTLQPHGRTNIRDGIPDNLSVDTQSGYVYATTFLKIGQTHKFFHSPSLETTRTAGTRIRRFGLTDNAAQKMESESVLVDGGELMPSATVAVIQRRNQVQRMLVGCVMCNFVVTCPI